MKLNPSRFIFNERFSNQNELCSNISICVHFMFTDIFNCERISYRKQYIYERVGFHCFDLTSGGSRRHLKSLSWREAFKPLLRLGSFLSMFSASLYRSSFQFRSVSNILIRSCSEWIEKLQLFISSKYWKIWESLIKNEPARIKLHF